jgi:hypothetical protein
MRHLSRKLVLVVAAIAIVGMVPAAQAPAQRQSFEWALVKPGLAGDNRSGVRVEIDGLFRATNATLKHVMQNAYGVHDYQNFRWTELDCDGPLEY